MQPTDSKKFADYGLDEGLVEACTAMGLDTPTPIQASILDNLNTKADIVAVSNTGTGKTLGYALPILHRLLQADKYFYGLILLPTRELSQQVHEVFSALGKEIGLRTTLLIGGIDLLVQGKSLAARPHIIIGTPGRVAYHFSNTKGIKLDSFRYIVLDECDKLLDGDFEGEVKEILGMTSKKRNIFLFTATITKRVASLKDRLLKNPLMIETTQSETISKDLVQNYIFLPHKYKEVYLYQIVRSLGVSKAVVFVSTCLTAERLERLLLHMSESVCCIHGSKPQSERTAIIEGFRTGSKNILIATDVVARGIDIPSIKLVLNYDLPDSVKDYIHRVGRTARAGQTGRTISFVSQYDIEDFQKLEQKIKVTMDEYKIDKAVIQSEIDNIESAKKESNAQIREEGVGKRIRDQKQGRKQPSRPKYKKKQR
ncbi:ATP-dependent RNA helicase DDX47/RRP3 [Nematocida sp. AWRm80]|nr:ATP-dependent RNA helicase DDX47/RRP3 [Nematocida sp. AWRm80]